MLFRSFGKDNLVNAIGEARASKAEGVLTEGLQQYADKYIEQAITQENATRASMNIEPSQMTDADIDELTKFVNNCTSTYIAELAEKNGGDISGVNVEDLGTEFSAYVSSKMQQLVQAQAQLAALASDSTVAFDSLQAITKSANTDGYISDSEKSSLVSSATKFVISQLLNGVEDNSLLASLNSSRSEERRVGKECRSRWSPYH